MWLAHVLLYRLNTASRMVTVQTFEILGHDEVDLLEQGSNVNEQVHFVWSGKMMFLCHLIEIGFQVFARPRAEKTLRGYVLKLVYGFGSPASFTVR